eukprot:TRINITY_DN335_c2_g1_i1.p1 TRINITY_DN335_c2_g1~~TRINITY_DN335_c2_g1_i1.p1  ORF type:complete len:185 (+),score=34.51 TRINITY_DN335_c2_g1_i1:51-557(+)
MVFSFAIAHNVSNAPEIIDKLKKGEVACGIVEGSLICSLFQLQVAGEAASTQKRNAKMTTKNVNSEIVFVLSPARNISQAYSQFGPSKDSKNLIFCSHSESPSPDQFLSYVKEFTTSDSVELLTSDDQLRGVTDIEKIKKTYKLTPLELSAGTVEESVVTKIATSYLQ